ncbi:hypothetical protein RQM59_09370 [Flavobacteriaceae bacterium S356]|uniref:Class I SAM-dependent methyltransferase n=1 Tax=Asprobacillus argus TaxID=3076534 RepID=A0ABU3LFT2_9FLAO|nr:hypothetical protein [Flavobacteriaceae bacterium S356]
MKRIQLFEFEDHSWFPDWIRSCMTNLLVVMHKLMGTKEVLVHLLSDVKKRHNFTQIVDLGSGSGGIMPEVIRSLNDQNSASSIDLLLTDLHPNKKAIHHINTSGQPNTKYNETPIDATQLTNTPKGLKTMINSFHHMPPKKAKMILQSAQENKQAILIYEMAENKMPLALWWLLLPISLAIVFIMALILTPFSKPITIRQLIFTYLIPIIPIFYAWDGQASLPRMYAFNDVESLLKPFENDTYTWEIKPGKKSNGKKLGYYILGVPK